MVFCPKNWKNRPNIFFNSGYVNCFALTSIQLFGDNNPNPDGDGFSYLYLLLLRLVCTQHSTQFFRKIMSSMKVSTFLERQYSAENLTKKIFSKFSREFFFHQKHSKKCFRLEWIKLQLKPSSHESNICKKNYGYSQKNIFFSKLINFLTASAEEEKMTENHDFQHIDPIDSGC